VGGARTALFNWLFARQLSGTLVLRIEDTDRARSTDEYTEAILDGMRWLGLDWDEGPLFQAAGVERHRAQAMRLLEEGKAYRDDQAIRFRIPSGETVWEDLVHGRMRFGNEDIEDLVILRSDGTPTYNLAVVSDDAEMRITHVVRGDDHLSNTPKQVLLYEALGFDLPEFGHVPMILGADGKRLSKRHGAIAVGAYADEGVLPEAMVNFLALLGWSPGDDREVMALAELVEAFSFERILRKSAVFDLDKLRWLNGEYIGAMPADRLVPLLSAHLPDEGRAAEVPVGDPLALTPFVDLLRGRVKSIDEMAVLLRPYIMDAVEYDPAAVAKHWAKDPVGVAEHLGALRTLVQQCDWDPEPQEVALRQLAEERGIGAGKLIHPLRLALVGTGVSPSIFDVLYAFGRERSMRRIDQALETLGALVPPETGERL